MSDPAPRVGLNHASCVCLNGRGVLITGPSGSGKSALALRLMAFGASLVSDDQTLIVQRDDTLWAEPAPNISGRIEARNFGILAAETTPQTQLIAVVDLSREEPDRLPKRRKIGIGGYELDLIWAKNTPNLAPALIQYLRSGWG